MVQTEKAKISRFIKPSLDLSTLKGMATALILSLFGIFLFVLLWSLLSFFLKDLPGPLSTFKNLASLLSNPFYDSGPNDKGIGWQMLASLKRVFIGFLIGSLIAVPVGFLIGISSKMRSIFNPVVQLLRPVSPMAWFPIGLALMKNSNEASIFVITITSLWPTLINTAVGASSVPEDF
ncbi:MAG: nitrate ABC transporter, permease protein, partial [Aquificaceae bacterium]